MTLHALPILPPGTAFFTVRLEDRTATTLADHIDRLRAAYAFTLREMPVACPAIVVLPDHLHAIWTEPGRPRAAERWHRIKLRFMQSVPGSETGKLWQPRFSEHPIRTAAEFEAAMEFCRLDPVKHGLVSAPGDWPHSSFNRVDRKTAPVLIDVVS